MAEKKVMRPTMSSFPYSEFRSVDIYDEIDMQYVPTCVRTWTTYTDGTNGTTESINFVFTKNIKKIIFCVPASTGDDPGVKYPAAGGTNIAIYDVATNTWPRYYSGNGYNYKENFSMNNKKEFTYVNNGMIVGNKIEFIVILEGDE